jgi:hypothetical protein
MAGGTVAWSGRALGPAAALTGRLRAGGWRRWVAGVLAFNIALGMGFSVVALRHQADARAHADVLLAELDAAASAEGVRLWRAISAAPTSATADDPVAEAAQRVEIAAQRVIDAAEESAEDAAVADAVADFRRGRIGGGRRARRRRPLRRDGRAGPRR